METQTVEFKLVWKDEYLKWICGFANAQGGSLYIGVDDDGNVVGVKNVKKLMEDIPNTVHNILGIVVQVDLMRSDEGVEYLCINVPQSNVPLACRGKYYYRSGTTNQELSGLTLNDFLLRKMNITWDVGTVETATLDDIDSDALSFFLRTAINARRLSSDCANMTMEQILRHLHLSDENGQLTRAALLLFGKDIKRWSITADFRIGRFGESVADLISQDDICCPLILMPDRIMEVLRNKYLTSPIHYEGLLRMEPLEIPEDGLREIICNAIVHRDYCGVFSQMKIFNDRIVLWNDGGLPLGFTVETLLGDHDSRPRNRYIADMFYRAGFIESWGRGYDKIRNTFAAENLEMPRFEAEDNGFRVTIKREKYVNNESRGNVIVESVTIELTERQRNIISFISNGSVNGSVNGNVSGSATTRQIMEALGLSSRTIYRELAILKSKGLIVRVGADKNGFWRIVENTSKKGK